MNSIEKWYNILLVVSNHQVNQNMESITPNDSGRAKIYDWLHLLTIKFAADSQLATPKCEHEHFSLSILLMGRANV